MTAPSSLSISAPHAAVDCHTYSSRRVLAILTACTLVGDPCRISCKPLSRRLQVSILAWTLCWCSSISSLLILCSIPKNMSNVPWHLLINFPLRPPSRAIQQSSPFGAAVAPHVPSLFLKIFFVLLFGPTVSHHFLLPSNLFHPFPLISVVIRGRISHPRLARSLELWLCNVGVLWVELR